MGGPTPVYSKGILLGSPIPDHSPKAPPSGLCPHRGLSYSLGARPEQLKSFLAVLTHGGAGSPAIHGTHHAGNTPPSQTSASWLLGYLEVLTSTWCNHLPHSQAPGHTPGHFCLVLCVTAP